MKIFIKTYGCQANVSDSEILATTLISQGHTIVDSETNADKIIVNSCSVKNKTQSKIFHYLEQHKDKDLELGGCLPKSVNIKEKFPNLITIDTINTNKLTPIKITNKETGIIQISQGCLNYCTFCSTKLARGNLKSYRIGEVKRAFENYIENNTKTIYLTSQDNGCYGLDLKTSLPELLNELTSVEGNYKIRVGMMNPWHLRKIKTELITSMKSEKIQKFIHIPVQSGSEKVLSDMKRIHTVQEFREFSNLFRKEFPRDKFPDSTIATDIIVGYPTETDGDFQQTLDLISEIKPEVLNISSFSSRPNTKASRLKQLDSKIIKERTKKLNDLYLSYRPSIPLKVIS